jgi:hypothetical protein
MKSRISAAPKRESSQVRKSRKTRVGKHEQENKMMSNVRKCFPKIYMSIRIIVNQAHI